MIILLFSSSLFFLDNLSLAFRRCTINPSFFNSCIITSLWHFLYAICVYWFLSVCDQPLLNIFIRNNYVNKTIIILFHWMVWWIFSNNIFPWFKSDGHLWFIIINVHWCYFIDIYKSSWFTFCFKRYLHLIHLLYFVNCLRNTNNTTYGWVVLVAWV